MLGYANAKPQTTQLARLKLCIFVVLVFCCFCTPKLCRAENYASSVKTAAVELQNQSYYLQAELNFNLSPSAKQALMNGIPLHWDIAIALKQQRTLIWDSLLLYHRLRYQIRYYALLNVFRVKAEHNGQINNFASLTAAMNSIAQIHGLKLLEVEAMPATHHYQLTIQINFDREALPIPLRATSYFDEQWALSSERYNLPL